jgi:hypothetical protein
VKSLHEMASEWSGGRTDPVCKNRGPRGELLPRMRGAEYCQWPTLSSGDNWGVVGGHRDSLTGLREITWERRVQSGGVVNFLMDSLSKEFRKQGFVESTCDDGGRAWRSEKTSVVFVRGASVHSGPRTVTISAYSPPPLGLRAPFHRCGNTPAPPTGGSGPRA